MTVPTRALPHDRVCSRLPRWHEGLSWVDPVNHPPYPNGWDRPISDPTRTRVAKFESTRLVCTRTTKFSTRGDVVSETARLRQNVTSLASYRVTQGDTGENATESSECSPRRIAELLSEIRTADGMFAVTSDQRIVYWNPEAAEMLGCSMDEVNGQRCYEVVAGKDAYNMRFCRPDCPVIRNARRGRPTESYDLRVRNREGSEIWVNITVMVLLGPRQRDSIVLHLMRDVTRERHVEERAHRLLEVLKEAVAEEAEPKSGQSDRRIVPTTNLTRRERDVLRLAACGFTLAQIAESLGISPVTARNHLANIQHKVGAKNRLQTVLYASQQGLI